MRCPVCGGDFDIMEAMMDSEWREIILLLPTFGGHGKLVFEYAEKFGVTPLRIKSKKILRLLTEMSRLFKTGEFEYQRRKYSASNTVVIEALKTVNNKFFANPMENHNYLKKVMISLVDAEVKEASKTAERELRERERQRSEVGGRRSEGEARMSAQEYLASVGKKELREGGGV